MTDNFDDETSSRQKKEESLEMTHAAQSTTVAVSSFFLH